MLVPLLLIAALPDAALMGDGAANYVETVRYDLEAELDPAAKIVKGRGTITWTNRGSKPVRELWWHLYLNAFRNERSTFLSEEKKLRSEEFSRGDWGWMEIGRLSAKGHELSRIFEHPDD